MEFCKYCGSEMEEGVRYCKQCGKELTDSVEVKKIPEEKQTVTLSKNKMIGMVTYKRINSSIILGKQQMSIEIRSKALFMKEKVNTYQVDYQNVKGISTKVCMDFWDLLYGIIFAVLGFFGPILFLFAAVCLLCGYGKEVAIELKNGEKINIPSRGKEGDDLASLVYKKL